MDKGLSSLFAFLSRQKKNPFEFVCCRQVLYLEAVFELLADKEEDDGVYAGIDGSKVDTKIIQDQ